MGSGIKKATPRFGDRLTANRDPGVQRLRSPLPGRGDKLMLNRRKFLANSVGAITGVTTVAWLSNPISSMAKGKPKDEDTVTVIQFSEAGQKIGPARVKKVHKTA